MNIENEVKKVFEDAVKAGEVVYTGGFCKKQYQWSKIDNRLHRDADLHHEVTVDAKADPYEVTGGIEEKVEYIYKGHLSAVYHADGDYFYPLYAKGVSVGYDYYGIFQIAYIVGDIAFTDPAKAIELYLAEMHRLEKEEQDSREKAQKAFDEKVEELKKSHRILYDGIYPKFYVDGPVVLDIKNEKVFPIVANNMGCVCFYAPYYYSDEKTTYYLHIFNKNNKKINSQKEARISFRGEIEDCEMENFFKKRRIPKNVIERWKSNR